MILVHNYLTWVTISPTQLSRLTIETQKLLNAFSSPLGQQPLFLESSVTAMTNKMTLAYIINEDNVKYFSPMACPLLCYRDRTQGLWQSGWRHRPFTSFSLSSFPSALQKKTTWEHSWENSVLWPKEEKMKQKRGTGRGREGARGGRHTDIEKIMNGCGLSEYFSNKIRQIISLYLAT